MADEQDPDNNHQAFSPAKQDLARRGRILHQIKRARTRLLVCFLTLPVYIVAVWILLNNQSYTDSFMFFYMALWSVFAVDMARRRCPNCGEQFFVRYILLNLRSHRCVHCGLDMDSNEIIKDDKNMKF